MKLSKMIRFEIDNRDEMCRFFRYAKDHNIQWTNSCGGPDGMVAFVKEEQSEMLKLFEFKIYYSKLNTKFVEGDIVDLYEENIVGCKIEKYYPKSNTYKLLLPDGKYRTSIKTYEMIHSNKENE